MQPIFFTFLAGSLLGPLVIHADELAVTLEKRSINAGGGSSESGRFTFRASLAQSVVGAAKIQETALESGFWTGQLEILTADDNAFEVWMGNLPAEEKPPVGQRGPDDSPAGDGVSNLLKFAFGLSPLEPAAEAMPTFFADAESDFIGLSFVRSADAEVRLKLFGSTDLDAWQEIPHAEEVVEANLPNNREAVQLLTGIKIDNDPRYFFRLRVDVD